jgi:hypothetical protein
VKCPTCSSSSIERVSLKKKAAMGVGFGLLAHKTLGATFKCKTCSYRW